MFTFHTDRKLKLSRQFSHWGKKLLLEDTVRAGRYIKVVRYTGVFKNPRGYGFQYRHIEVMSSSAQQAPPDVSFMLMEKEAKLRKMADVCGGDKVTELKCLFALCSEVFLVQSHIQKVSQPTKRVVEKLEVIFELELGLVTLA